MKEINWFHALVFLILGFTIGGLIATLVIVYDDVQIVEQYSDVAFQTCQYSNNLTDIVNLQGEIIEQLTGNNSIILNKLDCRLLLWEQK